MPGILQPALVPELLVASLDSSIEFWCGGYVNPSGAHFDNLSWPHIEQSVEAHRVRRSARYVS